MNEKRYWMDVAGDIEMFDGEPMRSKEYTEVLPVVVGSREWAVVMAMRGEKVAYVWYPAVGPWRPIDILGEERYADGWCLLPTGPKRGDRVRGWDAKGNEWTGPYWQADEKHGHWLGCYGASIYVERVEVLP